MLPKSGWEHWQVSGSEETLSAILEKVDDLQIEAWATDHEDQIKPLVDDILAGLALWSYCVDIISRLASSCILRDAFLRAEPDLLPQVIDKAIEHFDGNQQYLVAAISILRHPLPQDVSLPATSQTLLAKIAEKGATKANVKTLTVLDDLLNGACRVLIKCFPAATLRRFEEIVFQILRDASDIDQQSLGLVCLSIMKSLLAGATISNAVQAFFNGQKAHKTLQLVVLQVVLACNPQGDWRAIARAVNTLQGVPESVRWQWSASNAGVVNKLLMKTTRGDVVGAIRLQAIAMITLLVPQQHLPVNMVSSYEQCLKKICSIDMPINMLRRAVETTMPIMKSKLSAQLVLEVIQAASRACMEANSVASNRLETLITAFQSNECELSEDQIRNLWPLDSHITRILSQEQISRPHTLWRSLSTFLVQTAVIAARHGADVPISDVLQLLQSQQEPTSSEPKHWSRRPHPPRLFGDRESLQVDQNLSWQQNLQSALEVKSAAQHQGILTAVSSICADLEQRCNDFEAPLRAEKTKLQALQTQYEELNEAFGQVESQLVDRDVQLSNIESEKRTLSDQLDETNKEKTDLLRRIDEAEARLRKAQQSARDEITRLQHRHQETGVQHTAATARHQEETELLEERCSALVRKLQESNKALQDERDERERIASKLRSAEDARSNLAEQSDLTTKAMEALQEELAAAAQQKEDTLRRLIVESEELKKFMSLTARLQSDMEELRETTATEKADFLKEYRASADQARAEWESERDALKKAIRTMEQEAEESSNSNAATTATLESRVNAYQRKIEKLKQECAKKDDQITEAQDMRNRLMSAMGLGGKIASTLPIRSVSSSGILTTQLAKTPARYQMDGADEMDTSFDASVSSQQEPTPKRSKPRKAFKVPTLAPAAIESTRKSARSSRFGRIVDRQPLSESTPNLSPQRKRSPNKVMSKDLEEESAPMNDNDLQILDGWSFTDTDIVASTPGVALGADLDGETTVDG
ncbi:Hypothetical protein D9617_22g066420 [Elsinoe fawcettii]|nr:Hypothetical protein D9617_22g066420 [Elsinoe fawcettii]